MKKNICYIVLFALISLILIVVFKKKYNQVKHVEESKNKKEVVTIIETNSNEHKEVVEKNAVLNITEYYKKCGHKIREKLIIPDEIINMDKEEVIKYYDGWNVDYFSKNEINISKEVDSNCEQHYIVKDLDGNIAIYSKDINNNEYLIKRTDKITKYLPEEDSSKLKIGVNIVGQDNLSKFLEDYE